MNKLTKEEFIEAIQFIAAWGTNPDGYIQKNFRNFLNSSGDADDNSIQLNDEHREQLQIVDNIEENLDLLLHAERERCYKELSELSDEQIIYRIRKVKHIFTPQEDDEDFCKICEKNFRDVRVHLTMDEV